MKTFQLQKDWKGFFFFSPAAILNAEKLRCQHGVRTDCEVSITPNSVLWTLHFLIYAPSMRGVQRRSMWKHIRWLDEERISRE